MSKQKQKTIFVHNIISTCSELVTFMYWTRKFNEKSVVILWVSWCKNKSFWQRFTCIISKFTWQFFPNHVKVEDVLCHSWKYIILNSESISTGQNLSIWKTITSKVKKMFDPSIDRFWCEVLEGNMICSTTPWWSPTHKVFQKMVKCSVQF